MALDLGQVDAALNVFGIDPEELQRRMVGPARPTPAPTPAPAPAVGNLPMDMARGRETGMFGRTAPPPAPAGREATPLPADPGMERIANAPRPAEERYESMLQQGPPQLHGWKKALDIASRPFAIGREIEAAIPGSPGYYQGELGRMKEAATEESGRIGKMATIQDQAAQDVERRAKASKELTPTASKPENPQQEYADAVSDAVSRGVDPNTDPKVLQIADAIQRIQKEPAEKADKQVAGTLNGKPAWGILTPSGWISAQTRQPIPGFEPPPNFAETGLYEPTEVPGPQGGMVPGRFNKRTGEAEPIAAGKPAAIPHAAQTEIDKSLSTARDADNRYRTMKQNETDALKGNQQAMLSLVANHIGMTLGMQHGARISQAVWNEAIASTPWLQGIAAKFDSRGFLSGVTLTPEQIHQMVDLAQQKRQIQWEQATAAAQQYGVPNAVKMPSDLNNAWTPPPGLPDVKTGNKGQPIPEGAVWQVGGQTVARVKGGVWAAP